MLAYNNYGLVNFVTNHHKMKVVLITNVEETVICCPFNLVYLYSKSLKYVGILMFFTFYLC